VLHGIPGGGVSAASLGSQVLLRPAGAAVITVVGAQGALAGHTVIAGEAAASAGGAVAGSLVGALSPGMQIVGIDHLTHPGEVLGAGAQGAVGTSPLRLAIQTGEALAIVVHLTGSVVGAVILTQPSLSVPSLVPSNLTPGFSLVGRSRSGHSAGLGRRTSTWLRSRVLSGGGSNSRPNRGSNSRRHRSRTHSGF